MMTIDVIDKLHLRGRYRIYDLQPDICEQNKDSEFEKEILRPGRASFLLEGPENFSEKEK